MKYHCLLLIVIISFAGIAANAQTIPDDLKGYASYTYFSAVGIWYGSPFQRSRTIVSRYRAISRVYGNTRDVVVERIDYVSDSSGQLGRFGELPENAKLDTALILCCDELFTGLDRPGDLNVSLAVEKWKSVDYFILKIGKTRYLIDLRRFPLFPDINVVDSHDNVIRTRVDE